MEATPTLDAALKGKDRKSITLGVAMPGDVLGNIGSALDGLQEKSSHYYADDGRYFELYGSGSGQFPRYAGQSHAGEIRAGRQALHPAGRHASHQPTGTG